MTSIAQEGVQWRLAPRHARACLAGLVLVAMAPEVVQAAGRGRQFAAGQPATLAVDDLTYPPIVSLTALLVAMVLAVFKPWRRIRRARSR